VLNAITLLGGFRLTFMSTYAIQTKHVMQQSTITISLESIVDLAQNTLVPSGIRCEWVSGGKEQCTAVLGCLNALKKVSYKLPRITDPTCILTSDYVALPSPYP
jgi:hypothetical protein